jgi:hypothetical protein
MVEFGVGYPYKNNNCPFSVLIQEAAHLVPLTCRYIRKLPVHQSKAGGISSLTSSNHSPTGDTRRAEQADLLIVVLAMTLSAIQGRAEREINILIFEVVRLSRFSQFAVRERHLSALHLTAGKMVRKFYQVFEMLM